MDGNVFISKTQIDRLSATFQQHMLLSNSAPLPYPAQWLNVTRFISDLQVNMIDAKVETTTEFTAKFKVVIQLN